jgi:hypothetical protein
MKSNKWINFVKEYSKKHNISYAYAISQKSVRDAYYGRTNTTPSPQTKGGTILPTPKIVHRQETIERSMLPTARKVTKQERIDKIKSPFGFKIKSKSRFKRILKTLNLEELEELLENSALPPDYKTLVRQEIATRQNNNNNNNNDNDNNDNNIIIV